MSAGYDAVIIGAGVNGLTAAAYLAKAGRRVLVAEARNKVGGLCETAPFAEHFRAPTAAHVLFGLDPRVAADLKLSRHGLEFAVRDMALVSLRRDGKNVVLPRNVAAAARSIAIQSRADAEAYPQFRKELFGLARAARKLWWDAGSPSQPVRAKLEKLRRHSAAAYLDSWFESDTLKAMLAFDATVGGTSPLEPGSALLLVWRAAQEMCGLQGAVAVPKGGPGALAQALATAAQAAGAEVRTGTAITRIHSNGAVAAVEFASGETLACRAVLSSLSRRKTLLDLAGGAQTGFAEAAALERTAPRVGAAIVLLALNAAPAFGGVSVPLTGRLILAERPDGLAAAHARANEGDLPAEPAMEIVLPSAADPDLAPPGQHILSVLVRPVPLAPQNWAAMKTKLAECVVRALEHHAAGMARHITAVQVLAPPDFVGAYGAEGEAGGTLNAVRILAPWRSRLGTAIPGLFLCGASAEPVGAVSGRAGRIAAAMLLAESRP